MRTFVYFCLHDCTSYVMPQWSDIQSVCSLSLSLSARVVIYVNGVNDVGRERVYILFLLH